MQPVRHAGYERHNWLREDLLLPEDTAIEDAGHDEALQAWRDYLGRDVPVMLMTSIDAARKLLMRAYGVAEGERVGLPANCRRSLSESVKKTNKNVPHFIELDPDLEFVKDSPGVEELRLIWAQPVGGMAAPRALPGTTLLVDNGYTLPAPPFAPDQDLAGAATIWGLHLSDDRSNGALIAFSDNDLYRSALEIFDPETDLPDLGRALAQCQRLGGPDGLAARMIGVYQAARFGLEIAAGVPMSPLDGACSLPFGIALRIPDEADPATFISYARNELVPLHWLPEIQPMFYVSYQLTQDRELTHQSAAHLARWVISPLGPDFQDEEEVVHSVLVVVKASEYTGVRWYTDPERATWYNDLMLEWYGPTHDAYRMAFEPDLQNTDAEVAQAADD